MAWLMCRATEPNRLHRRPVDHWDSTSSYVTPTNSTACRSPAPMARSRRCCRRPADWIAFSTIDNKIKKIQPTGGQPITLADGSFFDGATWGDDDTIVYSNPIGLMRLPASGGAAECR